MLQSLTQTETEDRGLRDFQNEIDMLGKGQNSQRSIASTSLSKFIVNLGPAFGPGAESINLTFGVGLNRQPI
jgi:hypothetical protein